SGSVIHGMNHEQDMRRMGKLRILMPITAMTFVAGWLAIAGVPPFAGFWSKDEILLYVFANNRALYLVGLVAALLTAYYMTRQVIMVFFGEARWSDHSTEHGAHGEFVPHESPPIMLVPLGVLACLSIFGGLLQLPFNAHMHYLDRWLAPIVEGSEANIANTWAFENKYLLLLAAAVVAVIGIVAAISVYAKRVVKPIEPRVLEQAWYYDAAVNRIVAGPGAAAFNAVAWVDAHIVDGAVNGVATLVRHSAGVTRKAQSGFVRTYAAVIGIGAVALVAWFAWRSIA
ncbi:MAG: proton-conducting transporter membrane subunit, partial [Ilumatobacteraceae bacterium]